MVKDIEERKDTDMDKIITWRKKEIMIMITIITKVDTVETVDTVDTS